MSRNSRLKRSKKKKKGPGPGDKPRRGTWDIDVEDPSIYKATDVPKDPVKVDKSRNDAPTPPPIRRSGPRGG